MGHIKSVSALDYPATTNFVKNGGAETDTTFTTAGSSATVTRDTAEHLFGAASYKVVTANSDGSGIRFQNDVADVVTIAEGEVWTWSIWAKLASAGSLNIQMQFNTYDSGHNFISNPSGVKTLNSTEWTRFSVTATIPANAVEARFFDFFTSGAQGVVTYYVDGAQFEKQSAATPYVETDNVDSASRAASITQRPLNGVNVAVG